MRCFNTTALCRPDKHYMVDISARIEKIKELVDAGKYFTINRARQYGKTTTLRTLRSLLESEYNVVSLSFEGLTKANFSDEYTFVKAFCRLIKKNPNIYMMVPDTVKGQIDGFLQRQDDKAEMDELFIALNEWCGISEKPVVMLIDEVDSASDNQVFLDFLGLMREGYISREADDTPAFHSVILAGVTDVKHLKGKIRPDADQKENSPWNIAADFDIDMSLPEDGIKGMLDEYESDHQTGMDTAYMAKLIWEQTSGYPFLVSRICQLIDEKISAKLPLSDAWTKNGFLEALKLILSESNTLFQTITKNLNLHPTLKDAIRSILMEGTKLTYNPDQDDIVKMEMQGLIRNDHNCVRITNRIFETRLYNLFLSDDELNKYHRIKESDGKKLIEATV